MTKVETRRDLRGAAAARKPSRKPHIADRIDLWLSTGREIDGLWVGTIEGKPQPGLRRVEDALQLIKHLSPLHYSRVIHNLERVWVRLLTIADACYNGPLSACMLDKRFVLQETTTLEEIASTIVHEATHARLERWGISYDEKARARIEAICLRRELNFIANLPNSEPLREQRHAHWSGVSAITTISPMRTFSNATSKDRPKHCAIWEHRSGSSDLFLGRYRSFSRCTD